MDKLIVWGTCWFNESKETLIDFYEKSTETLSKLGFEVVPIIFDAKYKHDKNDIECIKCRINNAIILQNHTNIFPNKNYGVALITNKAKELKITFLSIVDSDWKTNENHSFVKEALTSLSNDESDIIIPNIGAAAGRSNVLVGKTVINLFYPEYKNTLLTPFPGLLIANTLKLYLIVNDENYHYDWGGEWDIISLAIKNKMKIDSVQADVTGVRHRANDSKIFDSFQIWKAVLSNDDIVSRFKHLLEYNKHLPPSNELSKLLLNKENDILDIINIINNEKTTEPERQLLYMIFYPLAYILGKIKKIPIIEVGNELYNKNELDKISDLAICCCKIILSKCDIEKLCKESKSLNGAYLSKWNRENQSRAIREFEVI